METGSWSRWRPEQVYGGVCLRCLDKASENDLSVAVMKALSGEHVLAD